MDTLRFYGELGFFHVLDPGGYDHVLFLTALAIPFTFRYWKRVFWLATLFTVAHCLSLFMAAFGWIQVEASLVEFLIPITILLSAAFNLYLASQDDLGVQTTFNVHLVFTAAFGLIHGLGFSNYFRMLMSGESEKTAPLLGFALGIEVAQLLIILVVLSISFMLLQRLGVSRKIYIWVVSLGIIAISISLIFATWPS